MWKFHRKKKFNLLLSSLYRLSKIFSQTKSKYILFSNLGWLFNRIAGETAGTLIPHQKNYISQESINYIKTELNKKNTVLDLGCAAGEITKKISPYVQKIIGIDYNKILIDEAKKINSGKNIEYIVSDIFDYLKKNKKFDILILSHILEHLNTPSTFLKKIKNRFTKIYIEIPDNDSDQRSHTRHQLKVETFYNDADHIYEFTRNTFENLLQNNKLQIIKKDYKFGVMKYWVKN
jgi:ubiquinone/menaquinone biosynthesis C-methylase UbiE